MTRCRAGLAALAVGVAALATLTAVTRIGFAAQASPAPAVAADAADSPRCASTQVAVAVNFSHWGNPVRLGCAQWSATSTGYDTLRAAGFAVTGTARYGPAFVCRLDGYPTAGAPDHEACVSTPSTKAYWSYWHADAGQTSWTYSTLGVTSYHPHAGSVDAWTFGAGARPPFAPSSVLPVRSVSHTTSAAPTTSRTKPVPPGSGPVTSSMSARVPARSTTGGGRRRSTAPTGRTGLAATTRPSGSAATPASTVTTSTTTATPATAAEKTGANLTATRSGASAPSGPSVTSSAPSGPAIVANDAAAARPNPSRGSVGPTVAAIAVIAALAAAGGGYTWRRRRQTDHGG